MNILLVLPGFIIVFVVVIYYERKIRNLSVKPKNKVHFYVARDKNGGLWLYLNKPVRADAFFHCSHGQILSSSDYFSKYGLNVLDYTNIKWEDEPVEAFVNMEE